MPDIPFLEKERKNLVGLVLTHAHEDHFGAIIDLWPKLQMPDLRHQIQRRAVRGQMRGRARSAENPGHGGPVGRARRYRPVQCRVHSGRAFDSGIACAGDPHRGRHGAAYRRLEDRPDADHRRADRRAAAARTRRCRRAGADRRFHQCGARRPLAVGDRGRQDHRRTGEGRQRPRRRDDLCLQRRAAEGGCGCREGRRPRGRGGRPRHGARGAGGARDRLSRRRAEFPRRRSLRPFPGRQGAGAVHGQPGRAARGAGAHRQ